MNTLEIFETLKQTAQNNPSALSTINWDDIFLCIHSEIAMRSMVYSPEQSRELSDYTKDICKHISDAIRFQSYNQLNYLLNELSGIVRALPIADLYSSYVNQARFDHAALRHYQNDTTIIIGDSHSNFFSGNEQLTTTPICPDIDICPSINDLNLSILHLGPCLAYTSCKPDSSMSFLKKTQFLCERFIHPGSRVMVSLGEIDIRVHALKQAELQDRAVSDVINDILANYLSFLTDFQSKGYKVYCWAPIATQSDSSPQDPAFPRYGTETARNEATLYFTDKLSELCAPYGIDVLSIARLMMDDNLKTRTEYLSSDYFHLSQSAMPLALPILREHKLI